MNRQHYYDHVVDCSYASDRAAPLTHTSSGTNRRARIQWFDRRRAGLARAVALCRAQIVSFGRLYALALYAATGLVAARVAREAT